MVTTNQSLCTPVREFLCSSNVICLTSSTAKGESFQKKDDDYRQGIWNFQRLQHNMIYIECQRDVTPARVLLVVESISFHTLFFRFFSE